MEQGTRYQEHSAAMSLLLSPSMETSASGAKGWAPSELVASRRHTEDRSRRHRWEQRSTFSGFGCADGDGDGALHDRLQRHQASPTTSSWGWTRYWRAKTAASSDREAAAGGGRGIKGEQQEGISSWQRRRTRREALVE